MVQPAEHFLNTENTQKNKVFHGLTVSHCNMTSWNGVRGQSADGEPEAGVGQAAKGDLVDVMWHLIAELTPKQGLAGWRPENLRR